MTTKQLEHGWEIRRQILNAEKRIEGLLFDLAKDPDGQDDLWNGHLGLPRITTQMQKNHLINTEVGYIRERISKWEKELEEL